MSRDQFTWGLSAGVIVLAIAAGFWAGLAAWTLGTTTLLIGTAPILVLSGLLIRAGIRLRRQAPGFSRASVRAAPRGSPIRRIFVGYQIVGAAQTLGIVLVGVTCWVLHRLDLLWPLIGLVVSLHFLPLGRLFSVRPYYVVGTLGTAVAITSLFGFDGAGRTVAVGFGLSLVLGGSAVYLIAKAAALADGAVRIRPSSGEAAPLA